MLDVPGMEVASSVRPARGGPAGDLHEAFRLGPNDWGLVLADPFGRGDDAFATSAIVRERVEQAASSAFLPSVALAEVNAALAREDRYCTATFARLELDTCGTWVTVANAGHPRPVVVRRAGWIDVRGHVGAALGVDDATTLADDRVGLGPGDALVTFSDAVTTARDARGEAFGDECLPAALMAAAGRPATELVATVVDALAAFAANPPADEVAVVALKVPDDAGDRGIDRVVAATGVPAASLVLPGYPHGDEQPDLWRQRPEPPREARMRLAPEPASAGAMRGLLRRLLRSWRMEELADDGDILLLATELAANAIKHARSAYTVVVRYTGDAVRVELGDGSRALPAARAASSDDIDGRGMRLVDAMSARWGVAPTVDGKRVWFEVAAR